MCVFNIFTGLGVAESQQFYVSLQIIFGNFASSWTAKVSYPMNHRTSPLCPLPWKVHGHWPQSQWPSITLMTACTKGGETQTTGLDHSPSGVCNFLGVSWSDFRTTGPPLQITVQCQVRRSRSNIVSKDSQGLWQPPIRGPAFHEGMLISNQKVAVSQEMETPHVTPALFKITQSLLIDRTHMGLWSH